MPPEPPVSPPPPPTPPTKPEELDLLSAVNRLVELAAEEAKGSKKERREAQKARKERSGKKADAEDGEQLHDLLGKPVALFSKALKAVPTLLLAKAVMTLVGAIYKLTPNIKGLKDVEKRAANINLEVTHASLRAGKQIADAIGQEVLAVEGLKFAYTAHEVGIDMHGKGMQNLFRATLRTGERTSFKQDPVGCCYE